MSIAEIKKGILDLSDEERVNLAAFLTAVRIANEPEHREELARKIDDRNPENWVDLEDFKAQLQD